MRKKILTLPSPRGFFPYAYCEEIRERGRRLTAFLEFINEDDNRPDRYWALLAPFLFDEEASDIEKGVYESFRQAMGILDDRQRQTLRQKLRAGFEDLRNTLAEGDTFRITKGGELTLGCVSLTDGGEIYYSLPAFVPFFLKKEIRKMLPAQKTITVRITPNIKRQFLDNLQHMCNLLLWWCLSWLRPQAIQICENCQRYVLRVTAHDVKYCSNGCRWQAFASKRNRVGKVRAAKIPRTARRH